MATHISLEEPKLRKAEKLVLQGLKLEKKDKKRDALKCYFEAFNLEPDNLDALKNLGKLLTLLRERSVAIDVFQRAVEINSRDPDILLILGNMALDMGQPEIGIKFFRMVAEVMPDDPVGYNNIATAYRQMEQFDEGLDLLQDIMPHFPESAPLWNTLATVVAARDGLQEALAFYEEAIRLDPKFGSALGNLAAGYERLGRYPEAVEVAGRAVDIDDSLPEPHFVRSTALLALGELEKGWEEYEWRQDPARPQAIFFNHGLPRWNGEDLTDKVILVCAEQGIGDEIMFASCYTELRNAAKNVILSSDRRLVPLLERSFAGSSVVPYVDQQYNAQRLRHFPGWEEAPEKPDYYIELASLPKFFRSSLDDFPVRQGYLKADPERVSFWKERLAGLGDGMKVGICWRSGLLNHERRQHYTELEMWSDILGNPDVTFVNLQYDDCQDELDAAEAQFGVDIHNFDDINLRNDLDDCAALTEALDLVISPAAAPAMMAIGVGTPLWVSCVVRPYWMFGQEAGTPLAKDCKVYVCPEERDWNITLAEIGSDLKKAAANYQK